MNKNIYLNKNGFIKYSLVRVFCKSDCVKKKKKKKIYTRVDKKFYSYRC